MKRAGGSPQLFRMIDANSNRAREAVRVCEDLCRFVLSAPALTAQFKEVRHAITQAVLKVSPAHRDLVRCRDSETDCGRRSGIVDKKKETFDDVFIRNCKRAGEAIRVIEEVVKLIRPKHAAYFQELRFRIYDLEKRTLTRF